LNSDVKTKPVASFGVRFNQNQWLQKFMFIAEMARLGVGRPGDFNFSFTDDERQTLVDVAMAMDLYIPKILLSLLNICLRKFHRLSRLYI